MDANILTDILLEKKEEKDQSLMEIYRESRGQSLSSETVDRAQDVVTKLKTAEAEDVCLIVSGFIAGAYSTGFNNSVETLLMAIDANRNPENVSEIIKRIENFINLNEKLLEKEKLFAVTRSSERSLDYLKDFFEDDFIDVLMKITGAKKPTVSRWFKTGKMNNRSSRKVSQITSIFYQMDQKLSWDHEKILKWFYAPLNENISDTPFSLFQSQQGYYFPVDLRSNLEGLGISWSNYY